VRMEIPCGSAKVGRLCITLPARRHAGTAGRTALFNVVPVELGLRTLSTIALADIDALAPQ